MQWLINLVALLGWPLLAGPVDFGLDELQRAIAAKGLKPGAVRVALEVAPSVKPESFQIAPGRISGGDRRGLLYGLLEAAEQIRAKGNTLHLMIMIRLATFNRQVGWRLRGRKQ